MDGWMDGWRDCFHVCERACVCLAHPTIPPPHPPNPLTCACPGRTTALSRTPSSHCSVSALASRGVARCRRRNATSAAAMPARLKGGPELLVVVVAGVLVVAEAGLVVALRKSARRYCTALSKVCSHIAGAGAAPAAFPPPPLLLLLASGEEEEEGPLPGAGEPGRLLLLPPRAARAAAAVRLWVGVVGDGMEWDGVKWGVDAPLR